MSSLWLCLNTCQKDLLLSSTLSLCERVKGCCKSCCKVEVTDFCCWPMIVSSSLRSVPLQKNVSVRVKCSQYCNCCDYKVNTTEGRRCSTYHSEEGTPRQRRRVVLRLTWVSSVWPLWLLLERSHFQQQQPFWFLSFISHSLSHFFSKMSLAHTHVDVAHTPCLWVIIGLLDSSLSSSISFWSTGLNFILPSRPLKQVNTVVVVHSLHCTLYQLTRTNSEKEVALKNT